MPAAVDWEAMTSPHTIQTVVYVVAILVGRWLAASSVRRSKRMSEDLRRRWFIQIRNLTLLALLLGLTVIWAEELATIALGAVAVAAALVIATKELIMCVSGTLLEGSGKGFRVGDRIEVNGHRGDVYDQTLLTTTLLEVGPGANTAQYSGRAVMLPNSVFLTHPVINESFTREYILHTIVVPLKLEYDWQKAERALMQSATEACADYLDEARKYMDEVTRARDLHPLSVEPRVTLRIPEPGRLDLIVRMPVPTRRRGRIEQKVLRTALPAIRQSAALTS